MPLYEYKCEQDHVTTQLVSLSLRDDTQICEECGERANKILSATKTHFKFNDKKLKR